MLPLAQKKSYIASIRGERQIHLQIASRGRKGRESRRGREGVFGQFVGRGYIKGGRGKRAL